MHLAAAARLQPIRPSEPLVSGFPTEGATGPAIGLQTVVSRIEPVAAATAAAVAFAEASRSSAYSARPAGVVSADIREPTSALPASQSTLRPGVTAARVLGGGLAAVRPESSRTLPTPAPAVAHYSGGVR